uniref:Uncharacterized protein n=1 Tax=Anguilla anguilla TaxID=7936 RepID=A0A0E9RIW0_ANGAN
MEYVRMINIASGCCHLIKFYFTLYV